jgi:tetratricopeptide (TPR) repeat protein
MVIFPESREIEIKSILGGQYSYMVNLVSAEQMAETQLMASTHTRVTFHALYNRGVALARLQRHTEAAEAFDSAFEVYASMTDPERPDRMLWYQPEPYEAFYALGRYQDVIDLASLAIEAGFNPYIEESFYWRGMALEALGSEEKALLDFGRALDLNPNYLPARRQLQQLKGALVPGRMLAWVSTEETTPDACEDSHARSGGSSYLSR